MYKIEKQTQSSLFVYLRFKLKLLVSRPNPRDGNPPVWGWKSSSYNSCHLRPPSRPHATQNSPPAWQPDTLIWNKDQIHISSISGLRLLPFHPLVRPTPPKMIHFCCPQKPGNNGPYQVKLKDKPFSHLNTPGPKSIPCVSSFPARCPPQPYSWYLTYHSF